MVLNYWITLSQKRLVINNIADANKGKWATNDVLLWYAAKKIEHKDKIEPSDTDLGSELTQ